MRSSTELWSIEDLGSYTQLSVSTLQRMRRRGDGPAHSIVKGRVRYRREDVMAWIASCEVPVKTTARHLALVK